MCKKKLPPWRTWTHIPHAPWCIPISSHVHLRWARSEQVPGEKLQRHLQAGLQCPQLLNVTAHTPVLIVKAWTQLLNTNKHKHKHKIMIHRILKATNLPLDKQIEFCLTDDNAKFLLAFCLHLHLISSKWLCLVHHENQRKTQKKKAEGTFVHRCTDRSLRLANIAFKCNALLRVHDHPAPYP